MPGEPKLFTRTKPHLNVGTIGHFAHGKTTLCAALTHFLSKRIKGRGKAMRVLDIAKGGIIRRQNETMTIQGNMVEYESQHRHYAHLDCPGKRDWLKNTAISVPLLDVAILVVAADTSIMAQTREHLLLAKYAGVSQVAVFINKCDLASDIELLDLVEEEMRQILADCGFLPNHTPIIRGAAQPALEGDSLWESSIETLIETLDNEMEIPKRDLEAPALLPIHHTYFHPKGVIMVGRLERGLLKKGERVEILGPNINSVTGNILDIEIFRSKVLEAHAGDDVSVLFPKETGKKFSYWNIARGQVLAKPGSIKTNQRFLCQATLLDTEKGGRHTPIFDGYQAHFFLQTAAITGSIKLSETIGAWPGKSFTMEVSLQKATFLRENMGFSFRDGCDGIRYLHGGGPSWGGTAGNGTITKILSDS